MCTDGILEPYKCNRVAPVRPSPPGLRSRLEERRWPCEDPRAPAIPRRRAKNPLAQYPEFQELRAAVAGLQRDSLEALRLEEESHVTVKYLSRSGARASTSAAVFFTCTTSLFVDRCPPADAGSSSWPTAACTC